MQIYVILGGNTKILYCFFAKYLSNIKGLLKFYIFLDSGIQPLILFMNSKIIDSVLPGCDNELRKALPIIPPLAYFPAVKKASLSEIPNPIILGFFKFMLLTLLKYEICSSEKAPFFPVTADEETIYMKPLLMLSIKAIFPGED